MLFHIQSTAGTGDRMQNPQSSFGPVWSICFDAKSSCRRPTEASCMLKNNGNAVLCDSSFIPRRVKDSSLLRYADSSLCWMSRRRGLTRSSIHNCQLHLARSMKPSLFDTVHLLHAQSSPSRVSAGGILGLWSVNLPKRGTLCASQDSFRTSIMRVSSLDLGHVDGHNVWAEPCDY